jgi:hypothetical protein
MEGTEGRYLAGSSRWREHATLAVWRLRQWSCSIADRPVARGRVIGLAGAGPFAGVTFWTSSVPALACPCREQAAAFTGHCRGFICGYDLPSGEAEPGGRYA